MQEGLFYFIFISDGEVFWRISFFFFSSIFFFLKFLRNHDTKDHNFHWRGMFAIVIPIWVFGKSAFDREMSAELCNILSFMYSIRAENH